MNTQNYIKDKTDGVVELKKTDDGSIVAVQKKYSERTGEEIESEVTSVDIAALIIQKSDLQAQIDAIDTIIADADKAPLVVNL